ncbi:hypothetical protein [Amycolatopsis sp. NPDC021455]|uniref:hypothetical protein n=1 Tax=Amycolatopsis sp. NPDC021455 TaxID=3154901 RepID=UPI0033F639E8
MPLVEPGTGTATIAYLPVAGAPVVTIAADGRSTTIYARRRHHVEQIARAR